MNISPSIATPTTPRCTHTHTDRDCDPRLTLPQPSIALNLQLKLARSTAVVQGKGRRVVKGGGGGMLKLRCSQQNYSSSRAKRLCLLYSLRDVDLAANPKGDIACLPGPGQ